MRIMEGNREMLHSVEEENKDGEIVTVFVLVMLMISQCWLTCSVW